MSRFEYDRDEGNIGHLERHNIRKQEVEPSFRDPIGFVIEDECEEKGESRWNWAGKTVAGRLLVVVFTFRHGKIRAITAFAANRFIQAAYEARINEKTNSDV